MKNILKNWIRTKAKLMKFFSKRTFLPFSSNLKQSSANSFTFGKPKNISFGKGKALVIVIVLAFVEDNANMSSIRYFQDHVLYFVQN